MTTTLIVYSVLRTLSWLIGLVFCLRERNALGTIGFCLLTCATPISAISHAHAAAASWADAATILSTPGAAFVAAALVHRQKRDGVWDGGWRA